MKSKAELITEKEELITNSTSDVNVQESLRKNLTLKGKIRSMFTLKVEWREDLNGNGKNFTYRGDNVLEKMTNKPHCYKYINELDAMVLFFTKNMAQMLDAQLFDNRNTKGEDLVMHYSGAIGKILINHLPKKYKI